MAPKRPATSGKANNGSSSSSIIPAKKNKQAQSALNDKDKARIAHIEKQVQARGFVQEHIFAPREDLVFWHTCQTLGFSKLLSWFTAEANLTIVREYYISREFNANGLATVRGKVVSVTPESIRAFLDLPPPQPCSWEAYLDSKLPITNTDIVTALCRRGVRVKDAWTKRTRGTHYLLRPALSLEGRCWQQFVFCNVCSNSHLHTIHTDLAALMTMLA